MIKFAVFDWNGTILSDVLATVEASNHELASIGRGPITLKQMREAIDMPLSTYFANLGITTEELAKNSEMMALAFHTYYEPRAARAHTRPGTRAALDELHRRGVRRFILSNHTMEGIYLQLERLKLGDHFEAVLANDVLSASYNMGKRDRLAEYLHMNKLAPGEGFIIGDTLEEIAIGRHFGLKTVAISGGHCSRERLAAGKPDVLIGSLHDLINAVEEISS